MQTRINSLIRTIPVLGMVLLMLLTTFSPAVAAQAPQQDVMHQYRSRTSSANRNNIKLYTVISPVLAVRSNPTIVSSNVLGYLNKGQKIRVYQRNANWCRIAFKGNSRAWVQCSVHRLALLPTRQNSQNLKSARPLISLHPQTQPQTSWMRGESINNSRNSENSIPAPVVFNVTRETVPVPPPSPNPIQLNTVVKPTLPFIITSGRTHDFRAPTPQSGTGRDAQTHAAVNSSQSSNTAQGASRTSSSGGQGSTSAPAPQIMSQNTARPTPQNTSQNSNTNEETSRTPSSGGQGSTSSPAPQIMSQNTARPTPQNTNQNSNPNSNTNEETSRTPSSGGQGSTSSPAPRILSQITQRSTPQNTSQDTGTDEETSRTPSSGGQGSTRNSNTTEDTPGKSSSAGQGSTSAPAPRIMSHITPRSTPQNTSRDTGTETPSSSGQSSGFSPALTLSQSTRSQNTSQNSDFDEETSRTPSSSGQSSGFSPALTLSQNTRSQNTSQDTGTDEETSRTPSSSGQNSGFSPALTLSQSTRLTLSQSTRSQNTSQDSGTDEETSRTPSSSGQSSGFSPALTLSQNTSQNSDFDEGNGEMSKRPRGAKIPASGSESPAPNGGQGTTFKPQERSPERTASTSNVSDFEEVAPSQATRVISTPAKRPSTEPRQSTTHNN